jgi:hypothetical protein
MVDFDITRRVDSYNNVSHQSPNTTERGVGGNYVIVFGHELFLHAHNPL